MYEGTVVSFDFLSLYYGISWDDDDYLVDNSVVTINMIEDWFVKAGQVSARARIHAGARFALMVFHHDSLERKAARSGDAQNGARKIPPSKSAPQLLPPRIRCHGPGHHTFPHSPS